MTRLRYGEERLGRLLTLLPPAPEEWTVAATELPKLERGLEQIFTLADADAEFRGASLNDLDCAIREVGVEPGAMMMRMVREWLAEGPESRPEG